MELLQSQAPAERELLGNQPSGHQTLEFRFWTLDIRVGTFDIKVVTLDIRGGTLDIEVRLSYDKNVSKTFRVSLDFDSCVKNQLEINCDELIKQTIVTSFRAKTSFVFTKVN